MKSACLTIYLILTFVVLKNSSKRFINKFVSLIQKPQSEIRLSEFNQNQKKENGPSRSSQEVRARSFDLAGNFTPDQHSRSTTQPRSSFHFFLSFFLSFFFGTASRPCPGLICTSKDPQDLSKGGREEIRDRGPSNEIIDDRLVSCSNGSIMRSSCSRCYENADFPQIRVLSPRRPLRFTKQNARRKMKGERSFCLRC